jgi:hypothetical protein
MCLFAEHILGRIEAGFGGLEETNKPKITDRKLVFLGLVNRVCLTVAFYTKKNRDNIR